jgi:TonB family protein
MNAAAVPRGWEGRLVDGRFSLLQYLGSSQRGDVFLTELPGQGSQKAAIKLIPNDRRNAADLEGDWDAIAKLSHPHLMRLFHTGHCEINSARLHYVVMEYAEEDLSQILPVRPLTAPETAEMLGAVVDVLSFLHAKGFVHGHIKPSNIMAVGDQLKVSSDRLQLSGKPSDRLSELSIYDAPEVGSGKLSPAMDVWALGITLMAALTQNPPAWDRSGQIIIPESIPEPFREIAGECLQIDSAKRCSLAQVASLLQPASAERAETSSTRSSDVKRRMWLPAAAGIIVIALIVGFRLLTQHGHVQTQPAMINQAQPASPAAPPVSNVQSGVVQGSAIERVVPDVPRGARDTIHGKIKVSIKLNVDSSGKVSAATMENAGPSKYFANLALSAARRWKFKAAQVDGQPVSSKWMLRFRFSRSGTEVVPIETSP